MHRDAYVLAQRHPYEEPHHTQVTIAASNGLFSGSLSIYCSVDLVGLLGRSLAAFPAKVPDEYILAYGSEDPADRFAYYLRLRAYTVGPRGQSALQVTMNLNTPCPDDGRSEFSIAEIEPARLSRLGALFVRLALHPSGKFRWTLSDEDFSTGEPAEDRS